MAVIVPSTNTVVEHDLAMIRPAGVTFHTGRMYIENPNLGSDEDFEALLGEIRQSTGATACRMALEAFGAERIAVFSPYQPVADRQVSRFFTEAGFSVAAVTGLRCDSATSIADVHPPELVEVIDQIDDNSVDAIVQVGTNLSFVGQAAELEAELGKPVLAINVATLWHALRATGINDQIEGYGRLLAEH